MVNELPFFSSCWGTSLLITFVLDLHKTRSGFVFHWLSCQLWSEIQVSKRKTGNAQQILVISSRSMGAFVFAFILQINNCCATDLWIVFRRSLRSGVLRSSVFKESNVFSFQICDSKINRGLWLRFTSLNVLHWENSVKEPFICSEATNFAILFTWSTLDTTLGSDWLWISNGNRGKTGGVDHMWM